MAYDNYAGVGFEDFGDINTDEEERAYQKHIKAEGSGQSNGHPDGCWFCGSWHHHSGDCPERD